MAASVSVLTQKLLDSLPRYEHIVNDKVYNGPLAKAQLLESPKRRALADRISGFSMYLQAASSLLNFFDNSKLCPEVQAAEAALEAGERTTTVIAGINAVECFKGSPRGGEMAEALLTKASKSLPESLRKELLALRRKHGA